LKSHIEKKANILNKSWKKRNPSQRSALFPRHSTFQRFSESGRDLLTPTDKCKFVERWVGGWVGGREKNGQLNAQGVPK
jgi:hypothetical protein